MTVFAVDQGKDFGTWGDPVSRFMYETSLPPILNAANLMGHVGDFGGANGLLKEYVPNKVTTIDIDPSKEPDVVADILTHRDRYDTAWCRYVMHYLTDQQVLQFLATVNARRLILVQFANNDLRSKYANSVGEVKYFRTMQQMNALLPHRSRVLWHRAYDVTPEFYKNRLGLDGACAHTEHLLAYEVQL